MSTDELVIGFEKGIILVSTLDEVIGSTFGPADELSLNIDEGTEISSLVVLLIVLMMENLRVN